MQKIMNVEKWLRRKIMNVGKFQYRRIMNVGKLQCRKIMNVEKLQCRKIKIVEKKMIFTTSIQRNHLTYLNRITFFNNGQDCQLRYGECNLYFHPDSLPVSASGNLTRLPPPVFTFSPLVTPTNTLVSLLLQLMKVTVSTENSFIFSPGTLGYAHVYRHGISNQNHHHQIGYNYNILTQIINNFLERNTTRLTWKLLQYGN